MELRGRIEDETGMLNQCQRKVFFYAGVMIRYNSEIFFFLLVFEGINRDLLVMRFFPVRFLLKSK